MFPRNLWKKRKKKTKHVDTVVNSIQPLPLLVTKALPNPHNNPIPPVDCYITNLWTILQNKFLFLMEMVLIVPWSDSYHNNCIETPIFFKNIEIILFENWQGINPMGPSANLANYKNKKFFANTNFSPTTLRQKNKIARDWPNRTLFPSGKLLFSQLKKLSKPWQRNSDESLLKIFISLTIVFKGLTQWAFVTLGTKLIYKTENLPTLTTKTNWMKLGILNWIQSINWLQKVESHNRHPYHDIPQTCGGSKSICPILIRPTENFPTHPRTSFMINERWSSKWDKHRSTINKIRLVRRTWRIF